MEDDVDECRRRCLRCLGFDLVYFDDEDFFLCLRFLDFNFCCLRSLLDESEDELEDDDDDDESESEMDEDDELLVDLSVSVCQLSLVCLMYYMSSSKLTLCVYAIYSSWTFFGYSHQLLTWVCASLLRQLFWIFPYR